MNLKDLSTDSRQIVDPSRFDEVVIERPIAIQDSPTEDQIEVDLTGYSNEFGGQLVDRDYEIVDKNINGNGNLEITLSTADGVQGGDYLAEFSLAQDGDTTDIGKFFYQNGVFDASTAGNLTHRISAELERFSGTFTDGQRVENATNFADIGGDFIGMSRLQYSTTSSLFRKHGGEPIPYFEGAGSIVFPDNPFSSRESTTFAVFEWNRSEVIDKNFIVSRLIQGDNIFFELRNEQDYIVVDSDYSTKILYGGLGPSASNIIVVSFRINTESGKATASVNREITDEPQALTGQSFGTGEPQFTLDPEGEINGLRTFDILTYDSYLTDEQVNKVAKQLSYFYSADLTSPRKDKIGQGSPKVQNHMFYDEEVLKYDLLVADNPARSYDISVDPPIKEWSAEDSADSVAFNSHQRSVIGTSSGDVIFLTSDGEEIWRFEGHEQRVTSVEAGRQYGAYSGSNDGTLRKVGKRGNEVWNFNAFEDGFAVKDVALFKDLAVYGAGSDGTVRRIIENDGSESWTYDWIGDSFDPEVNAIAVDKEERIFAAADNGELLRLTSDGDEVYKKVPFEEEFADEFTGEFDETPLEDVTVDEDSIYVTSGGYIKKLSKDGVEEWGSEEPLEISGTEAELGPVEVYPKSDSVYAFGFVPQGFDQKGAIFEINGDGSGGVNASEFLKSDSEGGNLFTERVFDLSIQPGSYEPHWNS